MRTNEEQVWQLRFVHRTHDLELFRWGQMHDTSLFDKIYRRERYINKRTHSESSNTARTHVIWLGFEVLSNSIMRPDYL